MYDRNAVKIYTDGSAMPNPGKGGLGMVVEFPDEDIARDNYELSEGYQLSTNNRMELKATIRALEWLAGKRFTRAIIITDSEYVYSNYKNAQYWKKDGWRSEDGKPYENPDLWDEFLKARQKVHFHHELSWEKGKTRPILLRVDALAKNGAKHPTMTDRGYQSGKFTAPRTASKKAATLYEPDGQTIIIRVYRKNSYGKNENEVMKITFDVYDETEGKYTRKHVAYQGKDCITLKRNNCYRAVFDENMKFPQIVEAESIDYLH